MVAEVPRRRARLASPVVAAIAAAIIGAVGTAGMIRATDSRVTTIDRVDELEFLLEEEGEIGPSMNFLLVGSDSRERASADDDDFGAIGDTGDVQGQRADAIMILRRDENDGLSITSIPRDLWVTNAATGRKDRINAAYAEGPENLVRTITESIGIPITHYVEVDFQGFKSIIDATGGVELCVEYPTRDKNSGLSLQPGCTVLDGAQALAFARSRNYEEFRDGRWRIDASADLGRVRRQQLFMRAAINGALLQWQSNPLNSGRLLDSLADAVRVDPGLDPLRAADSLRRAAEEDLVTYVLPVQGVMIDDKAVVELDAGADAVIAYFAGRGPAPVASE